MRYVHLLPAMIFLTWFLAPTVDAADPPAGPPQGVVVDFLPAQSGQYVGSPTIAIVPDGRYVAAHDLFGPPPIIRWRP